MAGQAAIGVLKILKQLIQVGHPRFQLQIRVHRLFALLYCYVHARKILPQYREATNEPRSKAPPKEKGG